MSTTVAELRLSIATERNPALARSEQGARIQLADAIMRMAATEGLPGRHNLNEQAAVEVALQVYGQTLAELLRGPL